jgi:ABC-type uncharacterized transport system involved in gliding motility auxiliary subunit
VKGILDWLGYAGLALLAALGLLSLLGSPLVAPAPVRWGLLAVGVALVAGWGLGHLRDWQAVLGGRTARYSVHTAVAVLLLVALVGVVEAISFRHHARLDLTETRRYSLSPQTIQVLRGLGQDVHVVAFFRTDQPGRRLAEDLLRQYARHSGGRLTWRVVDPDREPALARRYAVDAYGTVVLDSGGRTEKVLDAEEEKLTNALVKLTRPGKRVVYVLQGHGERELANTDRPGFSEARRALEQANYDVRPLALARAGQIPDDGAVVVIPGPRTEFLEPELAALETYLGRGGKLLAMVDPGILGGVQSRGLERLLARYGVVLGDNLVIEVNPIGRLFGIGPEVPIVQHYEPHPITRDLGGISTLFPLTRSVERAPAPPAGVTVQPLARTSPEAWGETDRASLQAGQVRPDPGDPRGPLTVAAVATRERARVVVYGTSALASNQFLNVQGNRDLFLNTVSWLAEQEDLIAIRPKERAQTPVFLTARQARAVFLVPVVVVPGLVLFAGVVAVLRHRAAR